MNINSLLYWLTFIGLYFELIGSFLLTAEAIGEDHLLQLANFIKSKRLINFGVLILITIILTILSKVYSFFSPIEALIIIFSLSILIDFAPRLIGYIIKRLKRGSAGLIGFIIFALGFCMQAYVSLMVLK